MSKLAALLAMLVIGAWQYATVTANYGGNWTALYCTGALRPLPPLVFAEHVYVFPNSTGYDGQLYHYVAHDPLMRSNLPAYSDDARMRYRRILVPALANILALGHSNWIDPAYEIVFLITVGVGVYWSCLLAQSYGLAALWGLLFLVMPAIPIATDRLVIDAALAALTVGFLLFRDGPTWKLWIILALAALTRETGLILIAAYCLAHALRREFRAAILFAASALPALAWYLYVFSRTAPSGYHFTPIPFSAVVYVIAHPWSYPQGTPLIPLVLLADYLAIAGALLAIAFGIYCATRGRSAVTIAAGLYALLEIFQPLSHWLSVYDFGRLETPLLLCTAAVAARETKPWLLAPLALLLPRIAIQLTPQLLSVIHLIV